MSFVSKEQRAKGPESVAAHPTLDLPWVKRLLSNPDNSWTETIPMIYETNTMFEETVSCKNNGILAHLSFHRPSKEPDAIKKDEECWILSLGSGIDGATGRAHGGFNMLALDQLSGCVAHAARPQRIPPATATLTVEFKAEVRTPCVIFLRAWVTEVSARKVWVRGVLEDANGKICSTSKGLFVFAKIQDSNL